MLSANLRLPVIALIFLIGNAHADDQALPEVTVVDTLDDDNFLALQSQSPISRETLAQVKAFDLHSHLYGSAGITLGQSNAFGISSMTLRGASGGVGLLSFDGVPLFANFAGYYSLRNFPVDVVESVNIERGFGTLQSNSRTLGGSINIGSRRIVDGSNHLKLEGGSYKTLNSSLAMGRGKYDNATVVLGHSWVTEGNTQSGYAGRVADRDDYRMGRALLNVEKSFSRGDIQASAYYVNSHEDTDGPGLTPKNKIAWLEDHNGWLDDEVLILQSKANLHLKDAWISELQLGYTRDKQSGQAGTFQPILPIGPFSTALTSELMLLNWQNTQKLAAKHSGLSQLLWGFSTQQQRADASQTQRQDSDTLISPNIGLKQSGDNWQIQFSSQWDSSQEYGGHWLYTLAGEWQLTKTISLWANGGRKFRTPGVNERLHPLFGNINLRPESSEGGEIGWRWQIDKQTHIALSVYRYQANDLVVLAFNPATGSTRSNNVGDVTTTSLEFSFQKQWMDFWQTAVNYSYMNSQDNQAKRTIAVRPENRVNLINQWEIIPKLNIRLEMNAHDGFWYDAGNSMASGVMIKFNSTINYQLTKNAQLYCKADNLTNNRVQEIYGFNYPHRAVYAGVDIKF